MLTFPRLCTAQVFTALGLSPKFFIGALLQSKRFSQKSQTTRITNYIGANLINVMFKLVGVFGSVRGLCNSTNHPRRVLDVIDHFRMESDVHF